MSEVPPAKERRDVVARPKELKLMGCRDDCGNRIEEDKINQWQRGDITGRYRCPACVKALKEVG